MGKRTRNIIALIVFTISVLFMFIAVLADPFSNIWWLGVLPGAISVFVMMYNA